SSRTAASNPVTNFMSNPSRKPVMQGFTSVLPVRNFVQMVATAPIRFQPSVACGLHPCAERSKAGTGEPCRGSPRDLALTLVELAGFYRTKGGEQRDGRGCGCDRGRWRARR